MTIKEIIAELTKLVEHHGDDVLLLAEKPLEVRLWNAHNSARVIVEWSYGDKSILVCSTEPPK